MGQKSKRLKGEEERMHKVNKIFLKNENMLEKVYMAITFINL